MPLSPSLRALIPSFFVFISPSSPSHQVNNPYVSTTLQLAPGIPLQRPTNGELLSSQSTWYEGMTFGDNSSLVREIIPTRKSLKFPEIYRGLEAGAGGGGTHVSHTFSCYTVDHASEKTQGY